MMSKEFPFGLPTICLTAALLASTVHLAVAQTPAQTTDQTSAATPALETHAVSLLNGKFTFRLDGVVARPDNSRPGGTMYLDAAARRFISVSDGPISNLSSGGKAIDIREVRTLLEQGHRRTSPDFVLVSESTEKLKGLEMIRIDATDKIQGVDALKTILLVGSGDQLALVHVYSPAIDQAGHAAAVANILGKKKSAG
jgi:hypothetical protein